MDSNPEKRDKTRFPHKSKITLSESEIGVQRDVRMFNYSDGGLYFEADIELKIETQISIGISNSPFAAEPDKFERYRGVIKWRKELTQSAYYYGYGVQLAAEASDDILTDWDDETREHARKHCTIPVKFESENQRYEGVAKNVSIGGAFIMTRDTVAIGQKILLEIPIKKKSKIARLSGIVSWSTQDGFGIKFLRSK